MPTYAPAKTNDLTLMLADLTQTAQLLNVPLSETTVQRVFEVFQDGYSTGSVQFKTTNKAPQKRGLYVRFESYDLVDRPIDLARAGGLLHAFHHPIDDFVDDIERTYPVSGVGVDMEVSRGMEKIWQFLDGVQPVAPLLAMPSTPDSVRASVDLLARYHFDDLCILATDYHNKSINLYFRAAHPDHQTPDVMLALLNECGFQQPTPEQIAYSMNTKLIALTYTWDQPQPPRLCYYVPAPTPEIMPDDPVLHQFVNGVPFAPGVQPQFIVSYSFGASGSYLKLENDYTGNVMSIFMRAIAG